MTALYENRDLAASVSEKLKIYAQPQRLMILSCLLRGERNVAEIGSATGIGQPALSQQLAELRRAELVSTRKEAKLVYYSLANEGVGLCVRSMEAIFGGSAVPEVAKGKIVEPSRMPATKPIPLGAAGFAQIL
jgi:DNA-binding transcriptional ArsR family regulator